MKKRVGDPALITPAYEDRGLFKKPPTELVVELIPKFGVNSRKDIIIKGLVQNGVEVDVIFAGRRKRHADELVKLLCRRWDEVNDISHQGMKQPKRRDVRLPTRIQGAWRTRVVEDDEEWYTREYQLLAARWAYMSERDEFRSFGEPPFQEQIVNAVEGKT